uniref:PCI domain-containing protein n=1 Tax=Lotharella globosa TaxID=91324 RepID=A0A6U3CQC7_9EUKA|mmetsp:Transcript_20455/g.41227  ORF Transcript_20455/g.41227 Transcript_20455/m.41227 type:complete len:510 (+) Transcript_20455:43-1572(+)
MPPGNKAKVEEKKTDKDNKNEGEKKEPEEPPKPKTPSEELDIAILLIAKGVKTQTSAQISRAVRKMNSLRKKLTAEDLKTAMKKYVPKMENRQALLDYIDVVPKSKSMEVEDGKAKEGESMEVEEVAEAGDDQTLVPEISIYLKVLLTIFLIDNDKNKEASNIAEECLDIVKQHNKRTMDIISARVYFYYSLAHTRLGNPLAIRNKLLALYRSACLHHDVPGQAVLMNAILANYLHYNMYGQAEMFCRVTTPIEKDNNQYARYLYYFGKINTVQLHYSDADEYLTQALRKCPKSAIGFRQVATKLLVIVQLLMGEIPERSIFIEKDLKRSLFPYFKLTQAVRVGNLDAFSTVLKSHGAIFERDGMSSLITRLRHNVIKTGLRKICLSYSKISLKAICEKLKYDSEEDIEYIVAKAIHDGVVNASIDRKEGSVTSKETIDVYSSDEPSKMFQKRINFCLRLRNEAVKAMQYPPDAHKPKREKEAEEEEKKKEAEEAEKKGDKKKEEKAKK